MAKKFTQVSLDHELRADADGMPVFRKCFEHEILLSFNMDDGAYEFEDWWYEEGSELFFRYLDDKKSFLCKYEKEE
jgi:hypothetical protein